MNYKKWIQNNAQIEEAGISWYIVEIAVSVLILLHSHFLNGEKFPKVRILNDTASLSAMADGICNTIAIKLPPTSLAGAIFHYILAFSVFDVALQICDSYVYYLRIVAVSQLRRLTWPKAATVQFFIWSITISWIPLYTIVPLFVDTNVDPYYSNINTYWYVQTVMSGLLNIYFVVEFLRSVWGSSTEFQLTDFRFALVVKSIIHFMVTIAFSWTWLFYNWGDIFYRLIVIICLHVLFNMKIENVICPTAKATGDSTVIPSREMRSARAPRVERESTSDSHGAAPSISTNTGVGLTTMGALTGSPVIVKMSGNYGPIPALEAIPSDGHEDSSPWEDDEVRPAIDACPV